MQYGARYMTEPLFDESHLKIRKLFPTPLISYQLPGFEALNERLSAVIFAEEARSGGVQHSNQGGWQSAGDFATWAGEPGAQLMAVAQSMARSLTAVHTADNTLVHATFDWHFNAWANINRTGDSNGVHGHAGAFARPFACRQCLCMAAVGECAQVNHEQQKRRPFQVAFSAAYGCSVDP